MKGKIIGKFLLNKMISLIKISHFGKNRKESHLRLAGLSKLEQLKKRHAVVRHQINAWIAVVQEAQWGNPQAIKDRYRSADFLHDNRVIFNMKGNHYRVVVKVDYGKQLVVVEWAGTHAEYSKLKL